MVYFKASDESYFFLPEARRELNLGFPSNLFRELTTLGMHAAVKESHNSGKFCIDALYRSAVISPLVLEVRG
jgi:hypothetical protein